MANDVQVNEDDVLKLFSKKTKVENITSTDNPTVIFITGISGSGKSTFIDKMSCNAFKIQSDNYRKFHPKLNDFIRKLGRNGAHKKTGNYSFRFALALRDKAIEKRLNIIYEATFSKLETVDTIMKPFKDNGYQIIVVTLPVDVNLSIQRNHRRYETKKDQDHTVPRIVEKSDIENMAKEYGNVIYSLKAQGITIIDSSFFDIKLV